MCSLRLAWMQRHRRHRTHASQAVAIGCALASSALHLVPPSSIPLPESVLNCSSACLLIFPIPSERITVELITPLAPARCREQCMLSARPPRVSLHQHPCNPPASGLAPRIFKLACPRFGGVGCLPSVLPTTLPTNVYCITMHGCTRIFQHPGCLPWLMLIVFFSVSSIQARIPTSFQTPLPEGRAASNPAK